jgi:hypothetical protein
MFATFILVLFHRYDRVTGSLWIRYTRILLGEELQLGSVCLHIILWLRTANRGRGSRRWIGQRQTRGSQSNGFAEGKAIASRMLASGNGDEHRWWNHRNGLRKGLCKSPFLAQQLSVFFALARYRWSRSCVLFSEVAMQTMKNYKTHYSLS